MKQEEKSQENEEEFPGQKSSISHRLVESMSFQPLDALIPKSQLASLINLNKPGKSKFSLSPLWSDEDQTSAISKVEEVSANLSNSGEYDLSNLSDEKIMSQISEALNSLTDTSFTFKTPNVFTAHEEQQGSDSSDDLFEGLSNLAKKSIMVSAGGNKISSCLKNQENRKHTLEVNKEHDKELGDNIPLKKIKLIVASKVVDQTSTDFPLSKYAPPSGMAAHVESFQTLSRVSSKQEYHDTTHWTAMNDPNSSEENYVTTTLFIDNIQMVLESVLKILVGHKNGSDLKDLLHELTPSNIRPILNTLMMNLECTFNSSLPQLDLVLKSINCIFLIFQLSTSDGNRKECFSLKYINKAVSVLGLYIQEMFEKDSLEVKFKSLTVFQSLLINFNSYLGQRPTLDEPIVTKILYSFIEIIMNGNDSSKFNNDIKSQACWDNIKLNCTNIYMYIFQYHPNQRDFIIDLVLPSFAEIPATKSVKKLFRVGNSNSFYMSYFTYNLLSLLQTTSFNISPLAKEENTEDFVQEILSTEQQRSLEINNWCEQISDGILKNVFDSYSDFKPSLEIYCNDLISCITHPEWPAAECLLTSLTKKLLFVFNPSNTSNVNVEALALSLLSSIGSLMLNIKILGENSNDDFSVVSICNYPEKIKVLVQKFELLRAYLHDNDYAYAAHFLWSSEIATLIKLLNLKNEDTGCHKQVLEYVVKAVKSYKVSVEKDRTPKIEHDASLYLSVIQCGDLLTLYEPYLKLVLSLIDSNKARLRSGAIKCFSTLISKDKGMINLPMIQETINKKLSDSSASVKDNILDIIEQSPQIENFYKQININYDDESVLVRKHVLRLNKKIYESSNTVHIKSFVLSCILKKIEDEEDVIIDLTKSYLLENLFLKIVTFKNKTEKQETFCKEIIEIISLMILSSEKCYELFHLFFNFYVLNEQIHGADRYAELLDSVKILTKNIISEVVEQQQDEENDVNERENKSKKLLSLICVIASSDGSFITREQLSTLYPFLSAADSLNTRLYTLKIFKYTISKKSISLRPKFLYDLETYLLGNLPKFSNKESEEAIQLCWFITKERRDSQRVSKACFSCLNHLSPYLKTALNQPSHLAFEGKLQKLLYMATGFGRFCDIKNDGNDQTTQLKLNEKVYEYVTKCLLIFARPSIANDVRKLAIKNLANLCSSHPKLFNSPHVLAIFDHVFEKESNAIKTATLESFYAFFTKEEQKIMKKAGVNGTVSSNTNFRQKMSNSTNEAEKFNDGVCSALVTRYLQQILCLTLSEDSTVSTIAIQFLGMVDSYSYANPSHYIHCIIALFINPSAVCRRWANKLLIDVLNKFENMVFSSVVQGINTTIEYSEKLNMPMDDTFLNQLQLTLGTNKSNKQKIMNSIVKSFQSNLRLCKQEKHNGYYELHFLCSNILNIDFEDKFNIYKFMKLIDVGIQEIDEHLDQLSREHPDTFDTEFKAIMFYNILLEFRSCMFKNFVLNEDTLTLIGTAEQNDLKGSPPSITTSKIDFCFLNVTYSCDPVFQKKAIVDRFWASRG